MKLVTAALLAVALVLPVVGLASPVSAITGIPTALSQTLTPVQTTQPAGKNGHKCHRHHKHHRHHGHHGHHKHHKKTAPTTPAA